ncbi:MAG: TIGR02530 family flagellar biosynthesis protein [Eubacteriales bacterium]
MGFRIDKGQYIPVETKKNNGVQKSSQDNFEQLLQQTMGQKQDVKISSHAQQRMQERNIQLEESDMAVIAQAMDDLKHKGARESLMLYKDMTFIASVNNRTIITALQEKEAGIVTNIDSAVIIK